MKRMHMGITVADIGAARTFYTKLLGQEPTLIRDDYVGTSWPRSGAGGRPSR